MFGNTDVENKEDSLPSWISDYLGEKSYMEDEVTRLPSSPRRDFSSSMDSPPVVPFPSLEKEINIMTQDDLDYLRESCFIPSSIQTRLLKAGETIEFAHPS